MTPEAPLTAAAGDESIVAHASELAVPTSQQRTIVERIWQAGGEIISINPVRKSLEQLFLELTNLPNEKGTGK